MKLAFGFSFWKIEDRGFRTFYEHENNTPLDRSKLACTSDDLAKLNGCFNKTDVMESCNRERRNTKWSFYTFTHLTVFAASIKNVPLGCKDAVLPECLLKTHTINCLTYAENTRQPYNDKLCLFRAPALHLHGTRRLEEETSELFNLIISKMDGLSTDQFHRVHMNDMPIVEDLLTLNILLYDVDIVDGNIIGEIARRSAQKGENTVRLLRYNNHLCYVNNIKAVFQSSAALNVTVFSTKNSIWSDV